MPKLDIEKDFDLKSGDVSEKDSELLKYIIKRQSDMDMDRNKESAKRDIWDDAVASPIYDKQDGKAMVNMPVEQSIKEMRIWLIPDDLPIRVVPNGRADIDILEPAKYVLDFFIDRENVQRELKKRDSDKFDYWTWILASWLWNEMKVINKAKGEGGFYNTEYEEEKVSIRHIGIKNVPIRDFWKEEWALTIEEAIDCIHRERPSVDDLRLRYLNDNWGNRKGFKYVASVWVSNEESKSYNNNDTVTDRKVELRHYYNKLNWRYCIIANKVRPIYIGWMTMKHGELPFAVAQEYINTKSFYGIGWPEKLKSTKPYLNNFFKTALDRSRRGDALMTIGVESDGELWNDPSVTALWNFTGQGNVIPYNPNRDTSAELNMIRELEIWNVKNTGISVDPNFILQAKTAFQTWVFKEEQNARLKTNNDLRNYAIDRALTIMLANISQYAPHLYADVILDKKSNKPKDYNWLEIRIKDKKVTKKGKKQKFEDAPWTYDFFELDDKLLINWWMTKVKIETPSTTTNLKSLEKAELNEFLIAITGIAQISPEIAQKIPVDDLIERLELVHWFDMSNLSANTREKKNRKDIANLKNAVAALWNNTRLNDWTEEPAQRSLQSQGLSQAQETGTSFEGNNPFQTQQPSTIRDI